MEARLNEPGRMERKRDEEEVKGESREK